MKYLKKYKLFKEGAEFDIQPSDETNVKKSKEELTVTDNNIKDYNKKKVDIDNIYKNAKSDDEIDKKIDTLLGPDKEKRNPYLINYLTVANDQRRFKSMFDDRVANKLKIDEYKDLISQSEDEDQKRSMQVAITELNNKITKSNADLVKLKADMNKRKKDITDTTTKNLKEVEVYIKNISTKS
jgi:hypothetical protein